MSWSLGTIKLLLFSEASSLRSLTASTRTPKVEIGTAKPSSFPTMALEGWLQVTLWPRSSCAPKAQNGSSSKTGLECAASCLRRLTTWKGWCERLT